jgi:predicted Zn finger-like uncharacterized protein
MNIRCPNCQTVFRVDPAKVPADGIRAKCSRCAYAFRIASPANAANLPATAGVVARPAGAGPAVPPARPATLMPPAAPLATPQAPPAGAGPRPAPARPVPAAAVAAATTPAPRAPVFGSSDPKSRAQRIARALVSDIVAYHKKRVEETLASGRIRTEFRDEIMKSWEEYVAQVGDEMAKTTPYFRNALNDILAKGQPLF